MRTRLGPSTPLVQRIIAVSLAVSGFLVSFSPRASAQQDAGIIGLVTDESGAVLPGVTVTVTSPSLQVPSVAAVTDARGEFRITPLPIGTFDFDPAATIQTFAIGRASAERFAAVHEAWLQNVRMR